MAQTIIFCTRTHSQIEQIFSELKSKLPYSLRISPFASRKHSCIFEDLAEKFPGNALNMSCQLLRKLNAIQRKMDPNATMTLRTVRDIEDTANIPAGQENNVTILRTGCPFFYGYKKDDAPTTKPTENSN